MSFSGDLGNWSDRHERHAADPAKLAALVADLRASDRVKPSVKERGDDELLDRYLLAQGDALTHLGVLCLGRQIDRARIGTEIPAHRLRKLLQDLVYAQVARNQVACGGRDTCWQNRSY